ncbi:putative glycolipid-binding domain-containing protein [Bdellovibrio sp.]|uniref:putative glycolipid-binding domain-containing protein n=1 Tax=Bdellovibrio TaxID=958 RepID=UPI003221D18F
MHLQDVVWESLQGPGFEHLVLKKSGENIFADSLLVYPDASGKLQRIKYSITMDDSYSVQNYHVQSLTDPAKKLGTSDLIESLFVDIYPSPFTNTLPIQWMRSQFLQVYEIEVTWVDVLQFKTKTATQRYTELKVGPEQSLYRFESIDGKTKEVHFSADLTVDKDCLVLEYPGYFRRRL